MAIRKARIVYNDGREPVEVIASPRAQVATERHFKQSLGVSMNMEHVFYLAWAAAHYAGIEPRDFESWLDVIADVEPVATEGKQGADPTPAAPSPDKSSK